MKNGRNDDIHTSNIHAHTDITYLPEPLLHSILLKEILFNLMKWLMTFIHAWRQRVTATYQGKSSYGWRILHFIFSFISTASQVRKLTDLCHMRWNLKRPYSFKIRILLLMGKNWQIQEKKSNEQRGETLRFFASKAKRTNIMAVFQLAKMILSRKEKEVYAGLPSTLTCHVYIYV